MIRQSDIKIIHVARWWLAASISMTDIKLDMILYGLNLTQCIIFLQNSFFVISRHNARQKITFTFVYIQKHHIFSNIPI